MKLYLVGGAVRNHMLGAPVKDLDFAVEADSYEKMCEGLLARGLRIWMERPEFVTIRGQVELTSLGRFGGLLPEGDIRDNPRRYVADADFTLCRAEAMYHDNRHPSVVTPAPLGVDLSRRDFTVNAVAVSEDGEWIDPHNGRDHARRRMLTTVGDPLDRFTEDPLRVLRALRFAVVHGLWFSSDLRTALHYDYDFRPLDALPHERVREELNRALTRDWHATLNYVMRFYPRLGQALNDYLPDLWFKATSEDR